MSDSQVSLPMALLAIVGVCVAIGAATVGDVMVHDHGVDWDSHALGALKTVDTAQLLFREGDKDEDGNFDYGTLRELSDAQLVDGVLGTGTRQGYVFTVRPASATPEFLWAATASPQRPGETGDRYFMINQAGVVWYRTDAPFSLRDDCGVDSAGMPLDVDGFGPCSTCRQPIRAPGWRTLDGAGGSGSPGDSNYVCAECPAPSPSAEAGD